jgi:hypothetical protein
LIVHAAVVLLPIAALATVAAAAIPRWRRSYAPLALIVSLAAAVAIWLAQESGESLEERVTETVLVQRHADLAEQLLPWAIAVVVVAAAITVADRLGPQLAQVHKRALTVSLVALALIAGTGSTWTVVRVGHSGATATWHEVSTSTND